MAFGGKEVRTTYLEELRKVIVAPNGYTRTVVAVPRPLLLSALVECLINRPAAKAGHAYYRTKRDPDLQITAQVSADRLFTLKLW